jgi:dipeptidyl-peptidase-4
MRIPARTVLHLLLFLTVSFHARSQHEREFQWTPDGKGVWRFEEEKGLVLLNLQTGGKSTLLSQALLEGHGLMEPPQSFSVTPDGSKVLVFLNTEKVWRYNTRGDYRVFDVKSGNRFALGKGLPARSLMFAKLSPDGRRAAYVSNQNIYVEEIESGRIRSLTKDGNRRMINGTFDWVYEEEFSCRDGFRWSPDGRHIAFWQVDAAGTRDFMMIDNTDSVYSRPIPVEYPKVGESPSAVRIGVVEVASGTIRWMKIPGDPRQHYLPRMEWVPDGTALIAQQLNRKQNESKLYSCSIANGDALLVFSEKDEAWVDVRSAWDDDMSYGGWDWIDGGKAFLWVSEKDGWRHVYRVSRNGKEVVELTKGDFDVTDLHGLDESREHLYFSASPDSATRNYLWRVRVDGVSKPERVTPLHQGGTHAYDPGPGMHYAMHTFTNRSIPEVAEWVSLPGHTRISGDPGVDAALSRQTGTNSPVEFFRVKTADGVEMDGWMVKPEGFDPSRRYPVVFYVYSEPAAQTVVDRYGAGYNFLYNGDMRKDGYIHVSVDNRGTPAPKGRAWRKSIYRRIGVVNIRDQAMAAREILKRPGFDTSRVAVWGWSGGGSATLNLMFQHPGLYKTGIAIAAVANQLTYDNIYQERYMGLPQENREDFEKGSPIYHAANLRGDLLYIHGTGDDNVHYQNAEMLVNELVRHGKRFRFMAYPNRSHSISEGDGTWLHLQDLYTEFLREKCPPGPR